MKKLIFSMLGIFVLTVVVVFSDGIAQAESPEMKVGLVFDKSSYLPGEPINITLTLANEGNIDIITSKGFSNSEFYLLLRFFDDQEKIITSDKMSETNAITPPLPQVFPDDNGQLLQGELVEILEGTAGGADGWVLSFGPFNAHDYYPLANKSGDFTVKAVIPMSTYLDYSLTSSGIPYAQLDKVDWHGTLESNIFSFSQIADVDGDGYYSPDPYGANPEIDCDDNDPNVNPGAAEMPGNDIDDDCNPGTSDEVVDIPGKIIVTALKKTANTEKKPKWINEPIKDMPFRVYDKSAGFCAADIRVTKKNYEAIWLNCTLPNKAGDTDGSGTVTLEVPPGDYVVIGKYDPDDAPESVNKKYLGVIIDGLNSGETVEKSFLIR